MALVLFVTNFKSNYRLLLQQISWCNFSNNICLHTDLALAQCNSSSYYLRQKVMTCSLTNGQSRNGRAAGRCLQITTVDDLIFVNQFRNS